MAIWKLKCFVTNGNIVDYIVYYQIDIPQGMKSYLVLSRHKVFQYSHLVNRCGSY